MTKPEKRTVSLSMSPTWREALRILCGAPVTLQCKYWIEDGQIYWGTEPQMWVGKPWGQPKERP